jgi:hypothetical protein
MNNEKTKTIEEVTVLTNSKDPLDWAEAVVEFACPENLALELFGRLGREDLGKKDSHSNLMLLQAISGNVNLSENSMRLIFDTYFKDNHADDTSDSLKMKRSPFCLSREGLYKNPALTEDLIRYFFNSNSRSDEYLLKHANCPTDLLEYFFFNCGEIEQEDIAYRGYLDRELIEKIWAFESSKGKDIHALKSLHNRTWQNPHIKSTIFTEEELISITDLHSLNCRALYDPDAFSIEFREKWATHIESLPNSHKVSAQEAVLGLTKDPVRLERYARNTSSNIIRYLVSLMPETPKEAKVFAVIAGGTPENARQEYSEMSDEELLE